MDWIAELLWNSKAIFWYAMGILVTVLHYEAPGWLQALRRRSEPRLTQTQLHRVGQCGPGCFECYQARSPQPTSPSAQTSSEATEKPEATQHGS